MEGGPSVAGRPAPAVNQAGALANPSGDNRLPNVHPTEAGVSDALREQMLASAADAVNALCTWAQDQQLAELATSSALRMGTWARPVRVPMDGSVRVPKDGCLTPPPPPPA